MQRSTESDYAEAAVKFVFPKADENAALSARIEPVLRDLIVDGVTYMANEAGISPASSHTLGQDPRLEAAVKARSIKGSSINDTTEEALRGIFQQAFESGASNVEIADQIAEYFATNCIGADSVRPMTAAQTQVAGCVNDGRMLAARDVGGLEKYWIHGHPQNPDAARPSHVAAAETYSAENAIALDDKFVVDGEEMDAPGDSNASAGNVCNCTCSVGFRKVKS